MKLDPGFLTHWKTEKLLGELGAEGVVAVLRIWSRAQLKREWKGLEITPKRLALETKWKGDENHLFSILTDPEAPWLFREDDGTYTVYGFEEHQKQVIHLWAAGGKGGRPKKEKSPTPPKEIDTYSYSSSYPICETNGFQMVSEPTNREKPVESIHDIIRWINSLRPSWEKPAHWSSVEQHNLAGGVCTQIGELSSEERSMLKKFLNTDLPKAAGFWQPFTRSKFVETFADVLASAFRWAEKSGKMPSTKPQSRGVIR